MRFSERSRPGTGAVGRRPGHGDLAAPLRRCSGAAFVRGRQCLLGLSLDGRASPRRSGPSASRTPASPSVSPARTQGSLPRASCRVEDGTAWHVSHAALEGHDLSFPHLPIVLPIGDDAEGTWLVPLGAGRCAAPPRRGGAGAMARRARGRSRILGLVRDDPRERGSGRRGAPGRGRGRSVAGPVGPVLRRPGVAPAGVAARCAVVTMEPVAASDLTILVDRQAATIHPMGRVVRPHLQSAETGRADRGAGGATQQRTESTPAIRRPRARNRAEYATRRQHWRPERSTSGS